MVTDVMANLAAIVRRYSKKWWLASEALITARRVSHGMAAGEEGPRGVFSLSVHFLGEDH